MTGREPISHLARRAVKQPDTIKISEIKRMAEWMLLAYKEREREVGRINSNFIIEGNRVLEIGK